MYDLATQRHIETWTGTSYANAVSDIKYGYNSMGDLASVAVLKENGQTPAAVASSTQYDAVGGTSTTNLPNTVYTYDLGGRLSSTFDSSVGVTTTYTYKANTNDLQEVKTVNGAGTVLADDVYTYRNDGLKTGATEYTLNAGGASDTVTLTWQYDGLNRVTSETSSDTASVAALNYTNLYGYDLNSNRVSETIENGGGTVTDTITSTYNADDELTQTVDANNGTTTYQYDANGSQISVTSPTGTTTNFYDLQDRLASVVNKNTSGTVTSSATYIYDDNSIRIEETTDVSGLLSSVYYLIDGNNPTGYAQVIEQSATPGTPAITYIWGETLIQQDNAPGTTNAGIYYLIADAHGSTRMLVNSTGSVVQTYNYDGSGNALGFTPSSAITEYLYNQQHYDVISGQYYMRARNYDPATGTFTQQDTISPSPGDLANANLFLFAGADSINMFDPSGHDLMETLGSLAIQSMIGSIISPAIAPFASDALSLLIPSWVTQGMLDAVPDAALIGGNLSGFWRAGASPVSLGITGGLDLPLSAKDHYAALYDYAGGSLGFGGSGPRMIGGSLAVTVYRSAANIRNNGCAVKRRWFSAGDKPARQIGRSSR